MISFFNKLGNSWIAKVILALLGLSMIAFWGLGGISNTGNFNDTAITVGSKTISIQQLQRAFDAERMKLSQLMMQPLTHKQAMEMGLLTQTIQQQVTEALQEQIHEKLGLTASNQAVQKYVERHPAFKDNLGHFDQNLFNAYLQHTRMTQSQLAIALQKELANQHLLNTIRSVTPVPDTLVTSWQDYQNEERDIEALLIKQDKITVAKTPSQEELKDFYDSSIEDFIEPETRDIDLVMVTPDLIRANIVIPQEDLDNTYEDQKHTFDIPEKRTVLQIRFNSAEEAQQALPKITVENFEKIAAENGQSEEATNFGSVAQNELLPELGDAAFHASAQTVIGPIQSTVGWHILLVRKVTPARSMSKGAIYAKIKDQLIQARTYDEMYKTVQKLDDLLGEGRSLTEAADALKLPVQHFTNIDMTGEKLPENLRNDELLKQIFTSKQHEATQVVEQENSSLVAEVVRITPTTTKAFEDVRSEVKAKWTQEQQASLLSQVSENALNAIKTGNIPASQGTLIVEKNVKRSSAKHIPTEALVPIFKQGTGYQNATSIPLAGATLISVVKNIRHPNIKNADLSTIKKQLEQELAESMYNALIADYSEQLGVDVNISAIQKAFSVYQD